MKAKTSVFEKTYEDYISRLSKVEFGLVGQRLGGETKEGVIAIPVFGELHRVSANGITDPSGRQPSLDTCVILSKYVLLCPGAEPREKEWVSYRDLKDSGP